MATNLMADQFCLKYFSSILWQKLVRLGNFWMISANRPSGRLVVSRVNTWPNTRASSSVGLEQQCCYEVVYRVNMWCWNNMLLWVVYRVNMWLATTCCYEVVYRANLWCWNNMLLSVVMQRKPVIGNNMLLWGSVQSKDVIGNNMLLSGSVQSKHVIGNNMLLWIAYRVNMWWQTTCCYE